MGQQRRYIITDLYDGKKYRSIPANEIESTLIGLYSDEDLDEAITGAAYDVAEAIWEGRPYKQQARDHLNVEITLERGR